MKDKNQPDLAQADARDAMRLERIAELEAQYQRDVYGLNNEGDPIGGDPAGGYANDNARLRAELAALKAQEPIGWYTDDHLTDKSSTTYNRGVAERWDTKGWPLFPLYAAPVAKQEVVMPEPDIKTGRGYPAYSVEAVENLVARLNGGKPDE